MSISENTEKGLDPRQVRSRRALVEAGRDCLIRNPLASVSDIARHAGVGRATMYRHFETREDLIKEIGRVSLKDTADACAHIYADNLTGSKALEAVFRAVVPLGERYYFLIAVWPHIEVDPEFRSTYADQLDRLRSMVDEAKDAGDIRAELTTEWVVILFDNYLQAAWQMLAHGVLSTEKVCDLAIDTFFTGVR
ncbi:MAG: TetR/AcrR family transcriptional regulator [Pseudomonadota bacterium]